MLIYFQMLVELKSIDKFPKITSLPCFWVRRLYDPNFYFWKVIPFFLIKRYLGQNFFFYSNLYVKRQVVQKRRNYKSSFPNIFSTEASIFIWFNKYIKINNTICKLLPPENMDHLAELFEGSGTLNNWADFLKTGGNFLKILICHGKILINL